MKRPFPTFVWLKVDYNKIIWIKTLHGSAVRIIIIIKILEREKRFLGVKHTEWRKN